jgi:putative peptidoglycan lipid II flippase
VTEPDIEPRRADSAVGMGAATAASRLVGFVRVLVVAFVLGTTYLGNAFQAANSVSNVLFELLAAGALSAVLVPVFVDLLDRGDREEAERVAGSVLGAALIGLGVLTVIGMLAAPVLARALTVGVPAEVADDQRDLTTYLLRFFLPQVLLYAAGTVAIAVLHARRRFVVAAAAPIGNTVVMVIALLAFRVLVGPDPGFDLTATEQWLLVIAGTGGVVAYVTILLAAAAASGFRLRPRMPRRDERVRSALGHAGWGMALHTGSGVLLAGAIVLGAAVEGGVVAYQAAWVFFLAPYAVLAQPIHSTILPELVGEADRPEVFARSVRWALERMALFVLPVSAALVALPELGMRAVVFGETGADGAELIAAALAALALGLFPYSAFLLLARAYYALGDSRTPAVAALTTACIGVTVMLVGAAFTTGTARVAMLGLGHSAAFSVGALWLGHSLHGRIGASIRPQKVGRIAALSVAGGAVAWFVADAVVGADPTRIRDVVACLAGAGLGAVVVLGGMRVLHLPATLTARTAA